MVVALVVMVVKKEETQDSFVWFYQESNGFCFMTFLSYPELQFLHSRGSDVSQICCVFVATLQPSPSFAVFCFCSMCCGSKPGS